MKIATVLMAHDYPLTVKDTLNGIIRNVGDKIILHVDALGWDKFKNEDFYPAHLSKGVERSIYRNSVLGIQRAFEMYPKADWYCWTEYDCLFISPNFKEDLAVTKAWCLGIHYRDRPFKAHLLSDMIKRKIKKQFMFIGACMFLHHDFVSELNKIDFFNQFLAVAKNFSHRNFPNKNCIAFEEALWPTLAVAMGGKLKELAVHRKSLENGYRGKGKRYIIRFNPVVKLKEINEQTSIIHPIKSYDHPIREKLRNEY